MSFVACRREMPAGDAPEGEIVDLNSSAIVMAGALALSGTDEKGILGPSGHSRYGR
jgi:hypothetical protein